MTQASHKPFLGVWIAGGVGNQLFQFAAAYALALRTGATLLLDTNFFFHPDKNRDYALHKLSIDAEKWPWRTPVANVGLPVSPRKLISVIISKMHQSVLCSEIIGERQYDYTAPLASTSPSIYLHGYWQSPKYFAEAAVSLRGVIRLPPLVMANVSLAQAIHSQKSVAIHVRRGDYATHHRDTFGLIPYGHYAYAASLLRDSMEKPHFFLFSDDYDVAREMFGDWPDATVFPAASPEEDLALMSACKHQIIANSTFSWWAAWLNPNPGKIVIAPKAGRQKKFY